MSQSTSTIVAGRPPLVPVTWAGLTRPVHEGIVDQFKHIIAQWEARGGQSAYLIYSWWGFAQRPNNAGAHPRGVGIDINPADNPMVAKRGRCPSDMPEWFIDLWKAQGFAWGGDWQSKCDAMHMSKMPNEGGNGRIYEAPVGAVTEEPDMTDQEHDFLSDLHAGFAEFRGDVERELAEVETRQRQLKYRDDAILAILRQAFPALESDIDAILAKLDAEGE